MSSFDTTDSTKMSTTDKVNYNLDNILVSNVASPGDSKSVLSSSINIPNSSSITSDLFFVKGTAVSNYKASNLYFYPLLHDNITGITDNNENPNIVGELVIKLSGVDNSRDIAYACFLLEHENGGSIYSEVDKFTSLAGKSSSGGNTINLNDGITNQNYCIYYKANPTTNGIADLSKIVNVFVFSNPVFINSDTNNIILDPSNNFKNAAPFTVNAPTSYEIISKNIATINDDQIYIDCNLTGESAENVTTYNVPINSAMAGEDAEMNYMKMTVNFFIFIIGLVFCYTMIPFVYKLTVIDRLNNMFPEQDKKKDRNLGTDVLITGVSFIFILVLFSYGTSNSNYKIQTAGMALAVLYILSFCILQIKKTDANYMTTKIEGGVKKTLEIYEFEMDKLKEVFPVLEDWLSKVTDNMAAIAVMLGLNIVIDFCMYMFSFIDWNTAWEFMTTGSFFVALMTIVGIGMFAHLKNKTLLSILE